MNMILLLLMKEIHWKLKVRIDKRNRRIRLKILCVILVKKNQSKVLFLIWVLMMERKKRRRNKKISMNKKIRQRKL